MTKAIAQLLPDLQTVDPLLRPTEDARFGDYQANAAMGLAKTLKKNPRQLAQELIDQLQMADLCDAIEIAGPGFINFKLSRTFLQNQLLAMSADERLGIDRVSRAQKCLVDFSSPNLAKEMHVGHLRTTITGEAIARLLEFLGHDVQRINHVGDWGTQFGMLLEYLRESQPDVVAAPEKFAIRDLETFYRAAKQRFDADEAFADRSRLQVVNLQSGDETALTLWRVFVRESLRHCHELYQVLDVKLTDLGESFYNDRLATVVDSLLQQGIAVEDQGAVCVFLDGFVNREGQPLPMIIRKSDGGYNYDTTDLAALQYRICEQGIQRAIYVTDIRQAQHFAQVFAAVKKAGWTKSDTILEHIGYGMILGEDRKPFKTRDGNTVRLKDVLQEAIDRARSTLVANERSVNLSPSEIDQTAKIIGLAAVKYFDLSHSLASDYVFHWDSMLAMEGNTGPYMLYAYARICSIGRKAGVQLNELASKRILIEHTSERALACELLRFGDVIQTVAATLKPNILTDYLYNLSKVFNTFYDKKTGVSVIDAQPVEVRDSRLALCALTARVLKAGLQVLSIGVVEQM